MGAIPWENRSRLAWWGVAAAAALALALFVYSFVGTIVLGLFLYYAARPLHRRLQATLGSRTAASTLTMVLLVLPAIGLLSYVSVLALREFAAVAGPEVTTAVLHRLTGVADPLQALLQDPLGFLIQLERMESLRRRLLTGLSQVGFVANGLLHLVLALSLAFFLFRDGHRLERWFSAEIGDRGSGAHAFLWAIDRDLEAVYFGNLLTVLAVTALAIIVYNGFVLLAPPPVRLPFPTLLALLTGLATFVPLVVGKIVYVPATAYLVWEATRADPGLLWAPAAFLLVSFALLDILPQMVLRPIVSGRTLHTGVIMFSYVFGVALFGWYGLFYGPLLAVFVVQFANVVLPELVRGEPITAATTPSVHIGTDPDDAEPVDPDRDDEPAGVGEDPDGSLEQ